MTIKPRLKLLLTTVFIVISILVFGQTVPQWKFHIAFEDATGAKDSIFFVWDSDATLSGQDSIFGEYPMSMPTDTFQVYIKIWNGDSSKTWAISPSDPFEQAIYAKKYIYPIKISWDSSLFSSASIPFTVNCAELSNEYFFIFGGICQNYNMLLTDTVTAPWFSWGSQDHFPIGVGINYFGICCLNGIEENENSVENLFLFPNPVTNNLTILYPEKKTIDILNVNGQIEKLIHCNSIPATVDLTDLSGGVYIVRVKTDKEIVIKKIIKE